ncbi:MAG: copper chaperone PCu(A)C [Pseudomonadota bacterium]
MDVELEFSNPVIRMTPPGLDKSVGYVTLINRSDQAITIVAASSPSAGALEMHETTQSNGLMAMRRLKQIKIPPRDRLALEPNGKHLMLFRLAALEVGEEISVTLTSDDGRAFTEKFEVVPLGYQG